MSFNFTAAFKPNVSMKKTPGNTISWERHIIKHRPNTRSGGMRYLLENSDQETAPAPQEHPALQEAALQVSLL